MATLRRLIYVPILHTSVDMGTLAPDMKRAYKAEHGTTRWTIHQNAITDFWRGLTQKVEALDFNGSPVRVYQDGLPICGREGDIVAELAKRGSTNHRLVLELVERGAKLEGTEDPETLVAEYQLVKAALQIIDVEERERFTQETKHASEELLRRRDAFIAKRIDETLEDGETAILFIGMIHDVARYLPKDIRVEYLIYRLPFRAVIREDPL